MWCKDYFAEVENGVRGLGLVKRFKLYVEGIIRQNGDLISANFESGVPVQDAVEQIFNELHKAASVC